MLYRLGYILFWPILRLALCLTGGFRSEGQEYIPREGGVILAPNHASYSDPPIVGLACPRPVWFMAKKLLFKNRLLAAAMRVFNAFPVDVDGVDRQALRFSEDLLRRGEVLCVFPEGSVSDDGRLMPLKPGLALLALRAQVPIVPVALIHTHQFLSPNRRFLGRTDGGVEVRFGCPIDLDKLPADLSRHAQLEWITERLRESLLTLLPPEHQPAG